VRRKTPNQSMQRTGQQRCFVPLLSGRWWAERKGKTNKTKNKK